MSDSFNAHELSLISEARGKTIASILVDDNELAINLDDGSMLIFNDEAEFCCERRYMGCDDDLDYFTGAKFVSAEVRDGPRGEEINYLCKDEQFLLVTTSVGTFTVVNHNDHNGYYGGFLLKVRGTQSKL